MIRRWLNGSKTLSCALPPFRRLRFLPRRSAMSADAGGERPAGAVSPAAGALRLTLVYATFAGIWILLSDRALTWLFDDRELLVLAGTLKGLLFVACTSLLLFGLIKRQLMRAQEHARREQAALGESLRSQRLLAAIAESSTDAIFAKDLDGRYILFNPETARVVGKSHDKVLGCDDRQLFPPEQAEMLRATDRCVIAEDRVRTVEETVATVDGVRTFLTTKGTLHDDRGRVFGLFGIARDITERLRVKAALESAKAEAECASRAKSRFLAAASHDLRQPLSALTLYMSVLKDKLAGLDPVLLANMQDCIGGLNELLTDLLDLSKLEAGVVTPQPSDFPLAAALAGLESMHAPDARLEGLSLRCRASNLIAHTDPVLYKRMLGNLIDNAIRYTEHGGVLVACRRRHGKAWVEVWDTGIGIPADKTGEIFEEFRQLGDQARNRGSGLGLAIVARTAALLGLEIRVASRPGRGSLFALELPLGETAALSAAPPESACRPLRIALVDDHPLVLHACAAALEHAGHTVVAAASGEALLGALAALGGTALDIVVSDYRLMGGESGYEVITAVRARFGEALPAILITGDTDPQLLRSMADRGVVVLHKPLEIAMLQAWLEDLTAVATADAAA
jgi:PAS domain S-box-containing protein